MPHPTAAAPSDAVDSRVQRAALWRGNSPIFNRILQALPPDVCEDILHSSRRVEFRSGHVIYRAGDSAEHLYFVNTGLVSLLKTMADGSSADIRGIGPEGLVGLFAVSEFEHAIADYVVQVPLTAYRMKTDVLKRELSRGTVLHGLLTKYRVLVGEHAAQVSACNSLHSLRQRCCRWLLRAHDSVAFDEFHLTHEFMALLLGVQRPSVSMTANGLQKRGVIHYSHGRVTILDRAALEEGACECYRILVDQIEGAFGSDPGRRFIAGAFRPANRGQPNKGQQRLVSFSRCASEQAVRCDPSQ